MNIRLAAKRGQLEQVRHYVEALEAPPLDRLLQAATQDFHSIKKKPAHLELIEYLIRLGACPTAEMVYQAARGGHGAMVSILLSNLAGIDIHAAAAAGQVQTVAKRLESDPDTSCQQDHEGKTPLHYCCASALAKSDDKASQRLVQVAQLLVEAGALVDLPTKCGGLEQVTPLVHTCWTGGNRQIFEFLLAQGAQPSYKALWAAVGHYQRHGDGHYHLAARLLELGLDLNHCDDRTLLHSFAAHEDARGVAWLLEQGAHPNARSADNSTPLHAAAQRNSGTKIIELLVAAGADTHATDAAGSKPIDLARSKRRSKIVDFLGAVQAAVP